MNILKYKYTLEYYIVKKKDEFYLYMDEFYKYN